MPDQASSIVNYFHALLENATEVITILNLDGTIRYESPSVERVLGYAPVELVGREAFDFIHPGDQERLRDSFQRSVNFVDAVHRTEYRFRHKNGTWRTFESVAKYLVGQGESSGVLVNSQDVTDRRSLEQLQDDFVSMVSHELRTPLTIIKAATQEIGDDLWDKVDPAQKRMLTLATQNIDRLERMIADLVIVSRIESKKLTLVKARVNVCAIGARAAAKFQASALKKGLELRLEFPDSPCDAEIDAHLVERMFDHLLVNSIKFTDKGFVALAVRQDSAGHIVCSVVDSGRGISPGNLPRLFAKFKQFDKPLNQGGEGTGLGLCIVRGLAESHGGSVSAESALNKGTRITFTLPAILSDKIST